MMNRDNGFLPIGIREYATLHAKANRDENPSELMARLRSCVSDALQGVPLPGGAPIWVVGSVSAGYACFTCITGESFPSEDYAIDEVLKINRFSHSEVHVRLICIRTAPPTKVLDFRFRLLLMTSIPAAIPVAISRTRSGHSVVQQAGHRRLSVGQAPHRYGLRPPLSPS
jgi:hypothetical protein